MDAAKSIINDYRVKLKKALEEIDCALTYTEGDDRKNLLKVKLHLKKFINAQ
jgi:hypothetical protein